LLLNADKQLFDFSHFLKDTHTESEQILRRKLFLHLFDHNEDFFAEDDSRVYFVNNDSLYYYDGTTLQGLSPLKQHSIRFFINGHRFYVLHRDSVEAVYAEGHRIAGAYRVAGEATDPGVHSLGD